ncbi:putative histone H1-like [Scophthalmus maximus]|nr:putative histone H1-like [Scophthalmus maximus]
MEEEMAAPATSPAKAAKRRAPKQKKVGPSVSELIIKAMSTSKERSGVSAAAVNKALAAEGYNVEKNKASIKTAIKRLVAKGTLVQTKGTGVSGSFKMNKNAELKAKKPVKKAARKAKRTTRKAKRTPRKARKTTRKAKKGATKKPAAAKKPKSVAAKKPAATKRSKKKVKKSAAAKKATKRVVKKSQPRKPLRRRMSNPK